MLRDNLAILDDLGRGECIYVIAYEAGVPTQIFFGGWSYD